MYISLPMLPGVYDTVRCPFIKAKVGIDYFWVRKIEHEIENDHVVVVVWLSGGAVNRYREFLLDKGLFEQKIHFMDMYQKLPFEIDEILRKVYRN